jgi:hypothetical protein
MLRCPSQRESWRVNEDLEISPKGVEWLVDFDRVGEALREKDTVREPTFPPQT